MTAGKPSEEALRAGQLERRQDLERITDAFYSLDAHGRLTYANATGVRFQERPLEAVRGRNVFEAFPTLKGTVFEQRWSEVMAGGRPVVFEGQPKSGLWVEARAYPSPEGMSVYMTDVSARRQADEALRAANRLAEESFESFTDAFIAMDSNGIMLRVNRQAEALSSCPREALLGRWWGDALPDGAGYAMLDEFLKALPDGALGENGVSREPGSEAVSFETHYAPTGRWLAVRAFPSSFGWSVFVRDATETRRAQEELQRSEARYRGLTEATSQQVWTAGADGREMRVMNSAGTSELADRPGGEFSVLEFFELIHPEDREATRQAWAGALRSGRPHRTEYRLKARDGSYRWLATTAVPVKDPSGKVVGWTGTTNDVTESHEARAALVESRDRFERFMEHLPGQAFIKDERGRYHYANREWLNFFGLESFEDCSDDQLFAARFQEDIAASDRAVLETGRTEQNLRQVTNPDGSVAHQLVTVFPIPTPGGTLLGGIALDVTDRERVEHELRASEERFRFIAETTGDALYRLRFADMRYDYMSPAIEKLIGYSPAELQQVNFSSLVVEAIILSSAKTPQEHRAMRERGEFTEYRAQYRVRARDGEIKWLEDHSQPWLDDAGHLVGSVGLLQDVTARKAADDELQRLTAQLEFEAHHDALTGLPNRLLFEDRLTHALDAARRRGEGLAVLFMDLDRFKHINDTLGHEAGDVLLSAVGERLKRRLRAADTVSRRGGDEFTILVTGIDDGAAAARIAQDLLDVLKDPFTILGREYFVTASLGIALYPQDGPDGVTLQRHADVAMYRAKADGRDGFECFTPQMNAAAHDRLRLEQDLRRGLARGEIVAYYQPIVDAASGEIVALEALARWRHPELGLLAPDRFIPIAEESGLITPLGEQMLRMACGQMQTWLRAGARLQRIAVNISGMQLGRSDLVAGVKRVLSETGLDARRLELELSETFVMRDPADTLARFERLRELGVSLAIDDFGAGYSSMAYLRQLPFDRLKIDRQFVAELGLEPQSWALPQAMLFLAHSLGLTVVAEGVETATQRELLVNLGCDLLQGYYLARPAPAGEIEQLLRVGFIRP